MRIRWRRMQGALAGAAITAAMAVGVPAAAVQVAPAGTADGGAQPSAVAWVDCGGGFECATVDVPLDYRRPAAGTIGIALIRLPASDPAQRIGSMFTNPGGPGGSGVDFVRGAARFFFSPQVRARFDVVGFDPRGVGASAGIRCLRDAAEFAEFWGDLPIFPYTRAQEQPFIERTADYSRLCGQRNRTMLPHMSTVDVARDLDLLRAAVGDQTLTYTGFSYGSYLGEVYANLFPGRVRALVLDGVLDPETWADRTMLFTTEAAYGGEQSLDAFSGACADAGAACAFADGDDANRIRQRLDTILAGIRTTPMPAPNADPPGVLDYPLANLTYLLSMYDTFFWPGFAAGLAQAETGDASILLEFIRLFMAPPDVYDPGTDTFSAVFCTDGTFPLDDDSWPTAVRLSEQVAPTFSAYWVYSALPCSTWPASSADRYSGPWNRPTAAPILLANTLADPATAYSGAVRAQRRLADARLVTVDGWGHTTTAHPSTCMRQVIDRYLIEQVAPPNGLHCAPDAGPFDGALATAGTARTAGADTADMSAMRPWLPALR